MIPDYYTGVKVITQRNEMRFGVEEDMNDICKQLQDINAGDASVLVLTQVMRVNELMPAKRVLISIAPQHCTQIEFWQARSHDPDDLFDGIGLTN